MAKGIAVSTIGVTVGYCVETTKGTRPTTGYIDIPDIKTVPAFASAPDTHETSTLANQKYKSYIPGLADFGGVLEFGVLDTELLRTTWQALRSAYEAAKAEGLNVWFEIKHPILEDSVFFTGEPAPYGTGEIGTNAVMETNVYVTATNEPNFFTKTTTQG